MTYPGNPSLAPDVQQRILTTYRQTLELASCGQPRGGAARLRLRPASRPAVRPGARAAADAPVRQPARGVPALMARRRRAPAPRLRRVAVRRAGRADARRLAAGADAGGASGDLVVRLGALVDARRFVEAIALADAERRGGRRRSGAARSWSSRRRRGSRPSPICKTFLDAARQALQARRDARRFERLLRKARALDPTHPGLAELEAAKVFYSDPDRALAGRRPAAPAAGLPRPPRRPPRRRPDASAFGADLDLPELDFSLPGGGADGGFDLGRREPGGRRSRRGRGAHRRAAARGTGGLRPRRVPGRDRLLVADLPDRHRPPGGGAPDRAARASSRPSASARSRRSSTTRWRASTPATSPRRAAGFDRVLAIAARLRARARVSGQDRRARAAGPMAPPPACRRPPPPSGRAPRRPPRARTARRARADSPRRSSFRPTRRGAPRGAALRRAGGFAGSRRAGGPRCRRRFLLIGGAVLRAGRRAPAGSCRRAGRSLFPNSRPVDDPGAGRGRSASPGPSQLHAEGKTAMAIAAAAPDPAAGPPLRRGAVADLAVGSAGARRREAEAVAATRRRPGATLLEGARRGARRRARTSARRSLLEQARAHRAARGGRRRAGGDRRGAPRGPRRRAAPVSAGGLRVPAQPALAAARDRARATATSTA